MNTINGYQYLFNLYAQNTVQNMTENQNKITTQSNSNLTGLDTAQISQESLQALQQLIGNHRTHSVNPLQSLIDDGTITQDQADAVKNALDQARSAGKQVGAKDENPLQSLIDDGTLTQDQADAIKSAFEAARPTEGREGQFRKDPLQNLIDGGVITQDQADAIKEALEAARKVHEQNNNGENIDPLQSLIDEGTLTQDQADAVKTALEAMRKQSSFNNPYND